MMKTWVSTLLFIATKIGMIPNVEVNANSRIANIFPFPIRKLKRKKIKSKSNNIYNLLNFLIKLIQIFFI